MSVALSQNFEYHIYIYIIWIIKYIINIYIYVRIYGFPQHPFSSLQFSTGQCDGDASLCCSRQNPLQSPAFSTESDWDERGPESEIAQKRGCRRFCKCLQSIFQTCACEMLCLGSSLRFKDFQKIQQGEGFFAGVAYEALGCNIGAATLQFLQYTAAND